MPRPRNTLSDRSAPVAATGTRQRPARLVSPVLPGDRGRVSASATQGADNGAAEHENGAELERDNGAELERDNGAEPRPATMLPSSSPSTSRRTRWRTMTTTSFSEAHDDRDDGAPPPLQHATPDVELAEEQLEVGRPAEPEPGDEADDEEFEREVEESIGGGGPGRGGGRRRGGRYDRGGGAGGSGGGEAAAPASTAVAERHPGCSAAHRLSARKLARAATGTVARPTPGLPGHGSRDRICHRGRGVPGRGGLGVREASDFRLEVSATAR